MTHDAVRILQDLFIYRDNAYAEQWVNTTNGNAGYIKAVTQNCPNNNFCPKNTCTHKENQPINAKIIESHLSGERTVGVYQLGDDDKVKWICFDIDKDKTLSKDLDPAEVQRNAQKQVKILVKSCLELGIKVAVEDSGNRGYHVWAFMETPVAASLAQAVGNFVVNRVETLAGLHIEMFPKQVSAKSLGNLVKLPLGTHLKSGKKALFVDTRFQPIEDQIAFLSNVPKNKESDLQMIVDWYSLKISNIRRDDNMSSNGGLGRRVPLCLVEIMHKGAGDGMRDVAAFKIACYLRDRGLPQPVAMSAMQAWDENNTPPLGYALIRAKVNSAFSDAYGYLPCFDPVFDRHCSSSCEMYAMKMERKTSSTRTPTLSVRQTDDVQPVVLY